MGNLVKMLYESINSGLDNLVESVLNEKKQEISPEDRRDNELIRSAMKKRIRGRSNAKLTKEEQDALERNGWTSEGDSDRTFRTANGFIQFGDSKNNNTYYKGSFNPQKVYNKHKRIENDSFVPVLDSQVRRKKYYGPNTYDYNYEWQDSPARVNLADMGRKQKERHSSDFVDDYYDETRGIKKSSKVRTGYWGDGEEVPDNRNRLNRERELLNKKDNAYKNARTEIKYNKKYIGQNKDYINQNYEEIEQKRQDILNEIKHYKEVLASLDSKAEEYANEHNDRIKSYEDKNKEILDKAREKFNNRKRKNESLKRRKFKR